MNETQYDDLIGKIYDAAVMPELWEVFLEQLSDVIESNGTVIYLVDFSSRAVTCRNDELSFIQAVRTDPESVVSYDRYYSKLNVWFDNSKDLAEGKIITTDQLLPAQELVKTEWYNDWLKPQGYFHAMVGHLLKQESLAVRLSMFRAKQQAFSADEAALFARLMPHLRRSCQIYKKLSEVNSVQTANANLLNRLPVGVILFDNKGKAVFVNEIANALIRSSNGFCLNTAGHCVTGNVNQTRALNQLISRAAELGQSNAMSLYNTSNQPLSATVVSLQNQRLPFISAPAVALFIGNPDTLLDLDDTLLTQCYELSPSEAKLATALLRGQTPNDYAQQRGISNNTVKTQLKQVLAKTGTHRQSELLQLLTIAFGLFTMPTQAAVTKISP
jgi:DNA-binding CsgD family transcriptional regulator